VLGANSCGQAPRAANIEKLRGRGIKEMPEHGGLSVTVPGAVRLWEDAVERLGRLTLSRLLVLQCHLYKHWGILYLWTGEEKDDRG